MSTIVLNRVGRPLLLGALFYLFHWGAYGAYMPFLNVYFAKLGFSGSQFGLLAMLFPLGVLLCSPPLAALADHTNRRARLLQFALAGVVFSFVLLSVPTRFSTVAAVMVLLAIARSPVLALA
ncbi:MAG: MFS transporter, partial [Caldilineaceae bacterium]|nr:MFS transporter [Caldilineaceae bacterium]